MKISKIISGIAAAVVAVSVMAVSAFAADSIDTVMVIQENATWATTKSASVTITGSGDYTYTLDGLSIDPETLTVLYIKDASCVDSDPASGYTATLPDGSAVVKSFKINGKDVSLSGDSSFYDDGGKIIDMCFYNIWAAKETFFDTPAQTIESVEVTITVSAAGGAAADDSDADAADADVADDDSDADVADADVADDEDTDAELAEEDDDVAVEDAEVAPETVEEDQPAVETAAETAPAADTAATAPAKTGNTAAAAIAFVMAAAGAAAVVSKRK